MNYKDFREVCFHQGFAHSISAKKTRYICIVHLPPQKNPINHLLQDGLNLAL